jgi:hypothetical protein
VFTLPTNSSISLGLLPAASIRTGFSINVGMAGFSDDGVSRKTIGSMLRSDGPEVKCLAKCRPVSARVLRVEVEEAVGGETRS